MKNKALMIVVAAALAVLLVKTAPESDASQADLDEADRAWVANYGKMSDADLAAGMVLEPVAAEKAHKPHRKGIKK